MPEAAVWWSCSEGILAGEMKHGPLALVDEHMPILVVRPPCAGLSLYVGIDGLLQRTSLR